MTEFDYQIEFFKEREKDDDSLILLMDDPLLKMAGLWRASMVKRLHHYPIDSNWRSLWDCVEIDYLGLSELADETENRTKFQIRRLIELSLIYPDGTRTNVATRAILKFMAGRLA